MQTGSTLDISVAIKSVLATNAKQVADAKAGKLKAFNSLVGQTVKTIKGDACTLSAITAELREQLFKGEA